MTNQGSESLSVFVEAGGFIRGDVTADGIVGLPDALGLLGYLFLQEPVSCVDRVDVNDDGETQLGDAILLLNYLFLGGVAPAYPFPDAGTDLTPDNIPCA